MSKENNLRRMRQGETITRKRMYKANKQWVVAGTSLLMGVGLATVGTTEAHASEEDGIWNAHTSDQIARRIAPGQTQLTFTWGDTYWGIGQALNIDAFKLMAMNGLHDGDQYTIPVGHVVHWDGNRVTVKDETGETISDQVIYDNEKVDSAKTVASQKTDTPVNPVKTDKNGQIIKKKNKKSTLPKTSQTKKKETIKSNVIEEKNSTHKDNNKKPDTNHQENSSQNKLEDSIENKVQNNIQQNTENKEKNNNTRKDEIKPPITPPLVVYKEDLIEIIEEANSVDATLYTEESLRNLTQILNTATKVRSHNDATQEDVNAAVRNLTDAINDLVGTPLSTPIITVDKENLVAKIKEVNRIDTSFYTDESVKNLIDTLAYSQNIKNKPNATQEKVDKALDKLSTTIKSLVKKNQNSPILTVNKAVLVAKIQEANQLDTQLYTETSVENLNKILMNATSIKENNDATQEDINAALRDLNEVLNNLEKKPLTSPVVTINKTALEEKINEAKGIKADLYTADSLKKVTSALASAQEVNNNSQGTQTEVDIATNSLDNAIKGLIKKPVAPKTSTVKISYKGEDGKELKSTTITGIDGTNQEVTAREKILIKGERYKLVGDSSKTIYFGETSSVSFDYAADKANITINYTFDDGTPTKEIITPVQVGKLFIAEAKDFEGYTLKGGRYHFLSVDGDYKIVFQYTKN